MSQPDIIIWGGTGNFKVLCELLKDQYRIAGYFDNNPEVQPEYRGIRCLGDWQAFQQWVAPLPESERPAFLVSIGPGFGSVRLRLQEDLKTFGLHPAIAVHRTAFVADNASLGEGTQVYAGATVCIESRIGKACIINTHASIDHECTIGDGATIGPGATLAGLVDVGANADVYTGAVVLPRVRIGEGAVVGAGAVVLRDVPPNAVVVGNPARIIKYKTQL